ncbi:hypothetical protein ACFE04_023431 [Oxalis oulophora]
MGMGADIPIDILLCIFKRLFVNDIVVAGAVCKSWQLTYSLLDKIRYPPNVPWMMIVAENNKLGLPDSRDNNIRLFCNVFDNCVSYCINLPELLCRKSRCVGFGWMLTINLDLQINLINPLSKRKIDLPPESSFTKHHRCPHSEPMRIRDLTIQKAVVSTNPWNTGAKHHNKNCIIMTIYGEFRDVVYYKDKFYAVDNYEVFACMNVDNDDLEIPIAKHVANIPTWVDHLSHKYLVESCGELLLVCRSYDETSRPYLTKKFDVLKLKKKNEISGEYYEFVKVESLDGQALFIGDSASFSLSASKTKGMKGNCIYFTDDHFLNYLCEQGSGSDMGVLDLEDGKVKLRYVAVAVDVAGQSSKSCSPLWYI